jgi:hypothetical protein
MTIWTVFEHDRFEDEEERMERAVFVRDGFSVLAFLVPPLWLLANGMILVLIAVLGAATALGIAVQTLFGEPVAFIASLGLLVWFGLEARALRRWSLGRRGWRMVGVVEGKRFRDAERRWFTRRVAVADGIAGPAAPGPAPSVPGAGGGTATAGSPRPWDASGSGVLGVFPEGTR